MKAEIICPYCGESISLWLDVTGGRTQRYVEDCSVCCQPIDIQVEIDDRDEPHLTAERQD